MRISDWSSDVCSSDLHLAHRRTARDLERQRRRVDVVIGAVHQLDLEVDDREADHVPIFGRLAETLFHRRDIFARNVAALDLVDEGDAATALARRDLDLDAAELADRKSTRLNSSH